MECAGCGKEFDCASYYQEKGKMEFCSPECKKRHDAKVEELRLRLRILGDDNYFFKVKEVK